MFLNELFGQKTVSQQTIADLRTIDSLYRKMPADYDFWAWDFNYKADSLFIYNHSSGKFALRLLDTARLKEYCYTVFERYKNIDSLKIKKTRFQNALTITALMTKYKFDGLRSSGPGDCKSCSTAICKKNDCYVIKDLKNYCMPDDCFWPVWFDKKHEEHKLKTTSVTDNILFVEH